MHRNGQYASNMNTISIVLVKRKNEGLGFLVKERLFKPHVVVIDILKGGPAYENGLLKVGDVILAVNQSNLTRLNYKEALKRLRDVCVGDKAVLIIRVPGSCRTQLQTTFTVDGKLKTTRVTKLEEIHPPTRGIARCSREDGFVSTKTSGYPTGKRKVIFSEKRTSHIVDPPKVTEDKETSDLETPLGKNLQTRRELYNENHEESQEMNGMNGHVPNRNVSAMQEKKQFSMLKNWETDKKQRDTLHLKSCPINTCLPDQCKGSVMNPSHMVYDPRHGMRTKEDTMKLAIDFIEEYFESTKRLNSEAHMNRVAEVKRSIERKGTYVLTEPELILGAKLAWRNAPRCIGRIQWNKLQVFDCRHVKTTAEMFDAICTHLKYATNKGNIRSCITFFPPRKDLETEFRIWNAQLIRYAGYRQDDGSVIGDPVNVELTQLCQRMGWKGKGTPFDVLPLLLQANGQDPDLYELPEHLVLEVKIRHPQLDWLEDMGFKWYGVPAVANMMVDVGGVQFSAAPFNGWFMGTEVGRDLCDTARYNVLEPIAKKMGLDTRNTSSMWKDKAILEMNIAVLYSFQSDNVTIMDHHVATESFMKHFANEMKLRGGCPGDWVWLVPPVSGSTTPIFHQEILNYMLNPTCFYQPDKWRYHTWKDNETIIAQRQKKIHFKELARSVLLTSTMMTKAMAKRVKATILYATETGKSLTYAKFLQEIFNHAFDAKVIPMDEYEIWRLEYEVLVLVVTSTFGNGDPPENGESFAQFLQKMSKGEDVQKHRRFNSVNTLTPLQRRISAKKLRIQNQDSLPSEENGQLANVKFSVFGLGSRAYPHFCAFAHAIDSLLGEMEAERLLEIGEGDELCGQEESFRKWAQNVFSTACDTFCVGEDVNINDASASLSTTQYEKSKYRVSVNGIGAMEADYVLSLGKLHRKQVSHCHLMERINLQSEASNRSTILVKLKKENESELQFKPGDHLGIYPRNQDGLVKELISRLHDAPEGNNLILLEVAKEKKTILGSIKSWEADTRLPPCTLVTAFSRYLDITTPPTPQLLHLFADCAEDEDDKKQLDILAQGTSEYDEWKFFKFPNLVEVLDEFPSVRVHCSLLLSQLPLLQCRYYSISSSPDVYPGQIDCTVSVVSYNTQGGDGPLHHGVCSTYLNIVTKEEKVACFVRQAASFHLPNDESPCILVGPGTGIAPFRSFWQQRMHERSRKGGKREMALLFGCRHPDHDHLYQDEIKEAVRVGALSHSYTAFSRSPHCKKQYVQHVLEHEIPDFVFDSLYNKRGHFYVCGDVTMADDVNRTLASVLMKKGKLDQAAADEYVKQMKVNERYHEDIFGVTLRTSEVTKSVRMEQSRIKSAANNL